LSRSLRRFPSNARAKTRTCSAIGHQEVGHPISTASASLPYKRGHGELKGGSKQDRMAEQEWISLFWHEVAVREVQTGEFEMM
jgi:hypothetical protein